MKTRKPLSLEQRKKRELAKLLRSEKNIVCLTPTAYLMMLALSIELRSRDLEARLASLEKGFKEVL